MKLQHFHASDVLFVVQVVTRTVIKAFDSNYTVTRWVCRSIKTVENNSFASHHSTSIIFWSAYLTTHIFAANCLHSHFIMCEIHEIPQCPYGTTKRGRGYPCSRVVPNPGQYQEPQSRATLSDDIWDKMKECENRTDKPSKLPCFCEDCFKNEVESG